MPDNTLTVVDNRTGKSYTLPITDDNIRAMDLRQIKVAADDFGMMTYDPAFMNTACCESTVTFIDGDKGILRYRGYDIEDLAENCTFLQVAYLLVYGELPTDKEEERWMYELHYRMRIFENIKKFLEGFRYDAHPMGMLVSTVAALSTFYPDAKQIHNAEARAASIYRLIGKMPIIAAYAYRHRNGLPYIQPEPEMPYALNFLNMLYSRSQKEAMVNPVLAKALDVLFILHADHEQNCSTSAMRVVGSSESDPFLATAAAASALAGPLHGGANEAVLRMLDKIGSRENIPAFVQRVKEGKQKLMGFGHRVYKNYDPRARLIKKVAEQVFEVTGRNPKIDIAIELERIALSDEYFVSRKLYPNVDFYSGIIYEAMGFDSEMFTVLFAIPRTAGWLAQWQELVTDSEQKINRPRQVYKGLPRRPLKKADVAHAG
jgi:citrate synthase